MRRVIWVSTAMINPASKLFIRNAIEEQTPNPVIDNSKRNERGEPLSAENFPERVWAIDGLDDTKPLPDFFMGYGPWIVSSKIADVIRQFDIGAGSLFPVTVLKKDRDTPFSGKWYCLNFGNTKRAFMGGSDSPRVHPLSPFSKDVWSPPSVLRDGDLAVNADALDGPDIWIDPGIIQVFFASDRLAKAIMTTDSSKSFGFRKCRLI